MTSMNDLVIMKSQQAVTTSKIVADSFEKRHDSVLRDVDKLKKISTILRRCFKNLLPKIHMGVIIAFIT